MLVIHSSLCPCPPLTIPSQTQMMQGEMHFMQASLLAIDLLHATPAYWFFHECQETEWIEKEKFYVEIFMTDNGLSVGMSLEQRSKVKLLFQSCSHRALHMLEIPWKDYLMEEKKEIIRT